MDEDLDFLGDAPYVIAEIGGNHGGDVEAAKEYATAAADSGVDAVKFQLYQAENLITEDEPPLPLAGDDYDSQYERFQELELTRSEWREVFDLCESLDVDFSASVFDTEMLSFALNYMPFVKIASGDMTNLPLLRDAAATGKPLVISTGFSTFSEIRSVVQELEDSKLILLHCMGCYPTPDDAANLRMVSKLQDEFDVTVGYSDHTVGNLAPTAAVAKGARVIEKHFTLDKSKEIGDHRLSATPEQMAELVEDARRVVEMCGQSRGNEIFPCETEIQRDMRRSLATAKRIEQGETVGQEDLIGLRPGDGISPLRMDEFVGKTAVRDLDARQIIRESDLK